MSDHIPFLRRQNQHKIGKAGRKSEVRLAKDLKGRARPGSGNMEGAKGDIDLGAILLEAKSTINASMSLKLDWLLKIAHEARSEGKTPALSVSFVMPDGKAIMDGDWCLVPMYVMKEFL